MDSATPQSPAESEAGKHRRSHFGCERCRRRRQKCDQQRPQCGRCRTSGSDCAYKIQLQWGGRSFNRSRFGKCLEENAEKLESNAGGFVYTANARSPKRQKPPKSPYMTSSTPATPATPATPVATSLTEVDPLSTLSSTNRELLHHFVHYASRIGACHPGIQNDLCRQLVPMALQESPLFYSLIALSAVHRANLGETLSGGERLEDIAISMKDASIGLLRNELQSFNPQKRDSLLAAVLMLCKFEIYSGRERPDAWRIHFEGARALMTSSDDYRQLRVDASNQDGLRRFLCRIYTSLEVPAALTAHGLSKGQPAWNVPHEDELGAVYLDDYVGFSISLIRILREIGAAAWERRRLAINDDHEAIISETDLEEEADSLEADIYTAMLRERTSPPVFYPDVSDKLTAAEIRTFILSNEAFQHSALIYLYRHVRMAPASSPVVQASVDRILDCCEQMTPSPGLSPWITMSTPLFAAGYSALGTQRDRARNLLQKLYESLRIQNNRRALDVLEFMWLKDENGDQVDLISNSGYDDFISY